MSMNTVGEKDFYINAAISSKSKEYPGIMPVVACADVTRLGNAIMHNSNTCKATEIVGGGDRFRSLKDEYSSWLEYMGRQKNQITSSKSQATEKLGLFLDKLESFIKNVYGGLPQFIYPSTGAGKSGNILNDLEKNLIGKMKVWTLSSSGPNDSDYAGLIKDNQGINIAKVYGAEQLGYYNGSDLVSWMPTGAQFDKLSRNLNSLLGYSSIYLTYGENFFAYIVQTFMNVLFINNQFLPEADRLKIIDNYKKLLECIADSNSMFFEDYKKTIDELKENNKEEFENEPCRPVKFIQFLAKKICLGTSLGKLDLNNKQNEAKYIDLICGISTFLTGAQHPNQVLLEQWIFDENKESECVIGDAFIGKNNVLYLPFHIILQQYIKKLESAKSKKNKKNQNDNKDNENNENDKKEYGTQIENKNMLNFMLNLAGKFRYKKTKFDLINTEMKSEYHFGCQVTSDKKQCRVPTEYDTDISVEDLTSLLNKITEFYDFETELKDNNCKLDNNVIGKIVKYLLDGRQFHDDTFKKIAENTDFMNKLIETAQKSIADKECCYKNAYEILANEYFDLMVENKLIAKNSLSKEKLMKYFENNGHKDEIIELDTKLVVECGLISKLDAGDINVFLGDEDNPENQKKMIEILKLVIGRIDKNILNGLNLEYFDDELLETVILSRYNDLSDEKIGDIHFSNLALNSQKVLLKKMADNDFKSFSFKSHWQQNINEEAWKSLNITDWCKFVYNKILKSYNTVEPDLGKNSKILQLIPIGILSLFDTEECKNENKVSAFAGFCNDFFDFWSAKQVLARGNCPENELDKLKSKLKAEAGNKISLSQNAVEAFLSLQQIFQKFVKNKDLDNNNLSVEKMLFDFFETQLSDEKNLGNLSECLKYIFNGDENNYFAAMIIMEEFILLDKNTVKTNLLHLDNNKKQKLLHISEAIKSALNWDDAQSRKEIFKSLFSHISKINELMILFDKSVGENSRFKQFTDIYKSFLDRILSLYVDDVIEANIADKVPFIFLNNEESIKLFCQKLGDKININNFSEMINAINKVNVENNEYRISNALEVGKVLFIIDNMKQIEDAIRSMDGENNPDETNYDGLSGFMENIRRNAGLICNGYAIDESDNSIENHLGQYDKNGEISYDKLDSILCTMFKNICEGKVHVDEFIKKYNGLDKQKLKNIKENENQVGNFKAFEELMLPLIEKDYKNEDMDFVSFVQKYDLLKVIDIENLDTNMISMAFDCMHRSSLNLTWVDFVKKYYVLDKPNEDNGIIENDYHIKGLEDKKIQTIMSQILLEDKDITEILNGAKEDIIWKLYENLLLKDENKNIKNKIEDEKKEMEKMRGEVREYFENVVAIKHVWYSDQRLNVEKLSKIWFAKNNGDRKSKTNKLSTVIEIYQSKRTDATWKQFSEIYILRHLNQDTIKKYNELAPTYKEIKNLRAKASNLKEQVALFYRKLVDKTFSENINSICAWFQFQSGKTVENQFLMFVNKGEDIYDDLKKFVETLEKINEMYGDDEVKKICEKYKNKDKNGVEEFFSSIAGRVHFFEDYQTIIKKIPALGGSRYIDKTKTNENKFRNTAQKILEKPLKSNFDIEENFAVLFVRSLEKLNEILKNLQNENQNLANKKIESLKEIYDRYGSYGDSLCSLENIKVMFTKKDGKFEFETDFQQIQDILKETDVKDCDVFNKCLSIFKTDVLPAYESKLKQDASFSDFVKFIETGITSGYFSDAQICDIGIVNVFDGNDLKSYTLGAVIKKLPVIVGSASRDRLKTIAKDLCPKNRLEYVICDSAQPDQYISAMRKLFLHMYYSKAKTFIKDYNFESCPNIENQGQNQINTYRQKFSAFGRALQNTLLDLFKSGEDEKIDFKGKYKKIDFKGKDEEIDFKGKYKKIDFKGKFILGGCFFESMLREACLDNGSNTFKVEEEFDRLFEMIRNRILSVLEKPTQLFNKRLREAKELPGSGSFNTSLNELIACAFLSAHIYICSGHIDGVEMPENIVKLADEFYDKIVSMLARSTGKEEKFKDIKDVKEWINKSSLKYFIQGTFNLEDIPENERTADQMELEQTKLIQNYNERILEHILSRIDKQVSVFDVLENIYCDDENKVVYRFSDNYLKKFFENKVVFAAGKAEKAKKEHFLTLLKFLKRVKLPEEQEWVLDNLLKCAQKLGLFDESGKFVDEEDLKIWIENMLPIFSESRFLRCEFIEDMAYRLGDNISVLNLIDILEEKSEKELCLIYWLQDCKGFVSNLNGSYKPYKNGEKQNTDDVKKKLEDVIAFLNQIGTTQNSPVEKTEFSPASQFNLLNLFPLLDTINEISVDNENDMKKFKTFDDLKKFCDDTFFDCESGGASKSVLCILRFLYAISRIPADKTLLDVVKEDKYKIDTISNISNCSRAVFESAVQALYDCLKNENITDENRNDYIDFVCNFFENIKTDDFLNRDTGFNCSENQIKKLEQGKHVFLTISKIFNLVYGPSTKDSIVKLSKYINNTFADKREEMKGCDYRIPILCPIFCESIKNMTIEDILSSEVKFIWEILDVLKQEEFSWCWVDELKVALNEKIKDCLENVQDDQTRQDKAKRILLAFEDKSVFDLLNLEPLYDALNFSNLVKNKDSRVFKGVNSLKKFLLQSQKIENNVAIECYEKTIDRFIYAVSRLPQDISVIDILKMMKEKNLDGIRLRSGSKYKSQINSLRDIVSKIANEITSNGKKYTRNKKILLNTIDLLVDFLKSIAYNNTFGDDFYFNRDNEHSASVDIVHSIFTTLKTLLSKYQFDNLDEVKEFYNRITGIFGGRHQYRNLIENDLDDILKLMRLTMLGKCHIFQFLNVLKTQEDRRGTFYESWVYNDNNVLILVGLLERMEREINNCKWVCNDKDGYGAKFYGKTNIKFFINILASRKKYFERVALLAAKICRGYVCENYNFIKYEIPNNKDKNYLSHWACEFLDMFADRINKNNVGVLRKIALEYIISNFSDKINVFDLLFLLKWDNIYEKLEPEELTSLDKATSKKLVNKILTDKFCEGYAYETYHGYKDLEKHGKINFVSQILQEIGIEIEAEEKKRLCNELKKQKEQEQKRLMEKNKETQSNRVKINNDNQDRNGNKSNSTDRMQKKQEKIISTSTNINKEDTIIKNNELRINNINTSDNRDKNKDGVDNTLNQNETKNISIQKDISITGRQSPLTVINHANRIHSFSDNHKGNKKSKPILEYLFWFLTFCAVVFCIYFFATSAIVEAIIALIAAIIIAMISILIRRCSNAKEKPKSTIRMPSQRNNNKIYSYNRDLLLEMIKEEEIEEEIEDISEGNINEPNQSL